jgi:hypothetical protein
MKRCVPLILILLPLIGCAGPRHRLKAPVSTPKLVPVTVQAARVLERERPCTGSFNALVLDHVTTVPGEEDVRSFEANGSGVAINDLDNDGDLDIILANHADPNTILWNEGDLNLHVERLGVGDSRAVNIVDIDGDGWLDILLTRTASAPNYWHNEGGGEFSKIELPNVSKPLYAINWADLDGDHDLDLVGATYDAGLLADFGVEFLMSGDAGVYYYQNDAGRFSEQHLASGAQGLTSIFLDLNDDEKLDIMVGNDFAVFDQAWVRTDDGWQEWPSLETTTHSTMSFDVGDVNNDGDFELFATDMKPYADDAETAAAWEPVLRALLSDAHPEGDPQVSANMLQVRGKDGDFHNEAADRGLDATGWSWSSKFGDLNQDGFLDLYVVNGMMELTTFGHLPHHELVEENQALKNDGKGKFQPAPEWNLQSKQSGRGMSMADLDGDGDLDIVVNNLRGSARLFENQLCSGSSLQVDLFWVESGNTRAIGGMVTLHTSTGSYHRDVRAASGYLSGDPARIHFGFPAEAELLALEIRWPDGAVSRIEHIEPGTLLAVTRTGQAED